MLNNEQPIPSQPLINFNPIKWECLQIDSPLSNQSNVYLGKWYGDPVAIKQFQFFNQSSDTFYYEAELMARCQSPYIVRCFGACIDPEPLALVTEYMPKGTLYHLLHNRSYTLEWTQRITLALDICKGLVYLHDNDIVHRDLSSLHILLDENGKAKISHFNLSVKLSDFFLIGEDKNGLMRWRAPESFSGSYLISKVSDVYSYGMVLWEIASRALPFANIADENISPSQREIIPSNTPENYALLIHQCWSASEKRPEAKEIMINLAEIKLLPLPKPPQRKAENKQLPAEIIPKKSWESGVTADQKRDLTAEYGLFPGTKEDKRKVKSFYKHYPVSGMKVDTVKIIYNPKTEQEFKFRLNKLQQRANNVAFVPQWKTEREPAWREFIYKLFEKLTVPYTDNDYPAVKLFPGWHGTDPKILDSICRGGFVNLAKTDSGFFGKGLYSTYEAEYAKRVYSKGCFLLTWVACFSIFPVIDGDMNKLTEKGNYQNYDAHFVPVAPMNPRFPEGAYYIPTKPNELHRYVEMVTFDSSSMLPRYVVELKEILVKGPSTVVPRRRELVRQDSKLSSHRDFQETSIVSPEKKNSLLAIGLDDYSAKTKEELSFKEGDELELLKQWGDWWLAKKGTETGLVPSNYVKKKQLSVELETSLQKLSKLNLPILEMLDRYIETIDGNETLLSLQAINSCRSFLDKLDYAALDTIHIQEQIIEKIENHFQFIKRFVFRNSTRLDNPLLIALAGSITELQMLTLINCNHINGDALKAVLSYHPNVKIQLSDFSVLTPLALLNIIENCFNALSFIVLGKPYVIKTQMSELFETLLKQDDFSNLLTALLMHGAHLSFQQGAKPPLHLAIERGLLSVVQALLRYQIPINSLDNTGKSALDIAYEKYVNPMAVINEDKFINSNNYQQILFLLLAHGALECKKADAVLQIFSGINFTKLNLKVQNTIFTFVRKHNLLTPAWVTAFIPVDLKTLDLSDQKHLGFYNLQLTLEMMQAIGKQTPGLEHLIITKCAGFNKLLFEAILSWGLKSIEMDFDQALKAGIASLEKINVLANLVINGVEIKITQLNLSGKKFDQTMLLKLGTFIRKSIHLKVLELCRCNLSVVEIKLLAGSFSKNTSIEMLLLSRNPLGDEAASILIESISKHPALGELNLDETGIGVDAAKKLEILLSGTNTLKTLSLYKNLLKNDGVLAIVNGMQVGANSSKTEILECLILNEVGMTESGAIALSRALLFNRSIRILDVAYNPLISKNGGQGFLQLLQFNTSIVDFKSEHIGAEEQCINEIKAQIQKNKELCKKSDLVQCNEDLLDNTILANIFSRNQEIEIKPQKIPAVSGQKPLEQFIPKVQEPRQRLFPLPQTRPNTPTPIQPRPTNSSFNRPRPQGQFQEIQAPGRGIFFARGGQPLSQDKQLNTKIKQQGPPSPDKLDNSQIFPKTTFS